MESNYFYNIAVKEDGKKYISNLEGKTLLIYSPTSLKKANISNKNIIMVNWHEITKNVNQIEKFIKELKEVKEVVSFGGGSTIDICKYISSKLKVKYTCIPTMLSTNSYATNKVALIKNNKKITLEAKMPDRIIVDDELLKLSKNENLYGLADVLSIYTALYDWKIANSDIKEEIDDEIYNMSEKLLTNVLEFIKEKSLDDIVDNNMKLFEFIGIAGYITNLYGTGRPESGSEHIMAKEIESNIDIPHGMSVSVGILIMSLMQNREIKEVLNAINKMHIFENSTKYGLNKDIIKKSLMNLKIREDRYTIVNRYADNDRYKMEVIYKMFEIIDKELKI